MPQKWHLRQSIDYSITADKAILDFAARRREEILYNRYVMGRNAIAKGSRDTWTFEPQQIADLQAPDRKGAGGRGTRPPAAPQGWGPGGGMRGGGGAPLKYYDMLRDPAKRDPRGFIIPSDQPDFPTATKFVNTLIKSGVAVHRATKPFTVGGKTYPPGLLRRQVRPGFPGPRHQHVRAPGPPQRLRLSRRPARGLPTTAPAGRWPSRWAIKFDRILEAFDGPFQEIKGFAQASGRSFRRSMTPKARPASCSATRSTTRSSSSTGCSRPRKRSIG